VSPTAVAPPSGKGQLVLVVEDDDDVRRLSIDILIELGYSVQEALRRRPDLKVLFTTGYTRNAIVHNGTLDDGVQLIVKPFTLDGLAAKSPGFWAASAPIERIAARHRQRPAGVVLRHRPKALARRSLGMIGLASPGPRVWSQTWGPDGARIGARIGASPTLQRSRRPD
jgi:hypothetical protein